MPRAPATSAEGPATEATSQSSVRRWSVRALAVMIGPNLSIVSNQLFNSAANFLVTMVLVRLLGLAEFGNFTVYYVVALSISAVIVALTVQPAVSIAASMGEEERRQLLGTAAVLVLAVTGGVAVLLIVVNGTGMTGELLVLPFGAMLTAHTANELYRRLALFAGAIRLVWLLDVLRFVGLGLILTWGAGQSGSRLASFTMLQITVAYAVALALVTLVFLPRIGSLTSWSAHQARRIISAGRWLSISALLQLLHDNVFLVVGSFVAGMEAVGIVRACQTVVGTIHPFVLVLEHIFPRHIGQSVRKHGWSVALREFAWLAGIATGGIVMALALLAVFAEPLLALTLGPGAETHAWVMRGLCLVWVPYLAFIVTSFPLRALENTAPIAASLAISAILAVVISVPIVEIWGEAGMVVGQLIVKLVAAILLGLLYGRIWKERVAE